MIQEGIKGTFFLFHSIVKAQERQPAMVQIIGMLFEGLIRYVFLAVIIALSGMLILLALLYARNRIMSILRIQPLRQAFERLCDFSDRLDETYIAKNPYGSAMWLTRLIRRGVIAAAGLMSLYIIVAAIRL
jgi:hypothetical protein